MDYSRWLRSSPSHDRDPALGDRRPDQDSNGGINQDFDGGDDAPSTSTSTSHSPNRQPKSSLFDVPPGSRTIVSGGRQNGRQTPLTQSHSSQAQFGSSANANMMVDELEQHNHQGRLTRLQRKSMLKSDESSMLANENSAQQPQHDDNDMHDPKEEQDAQSMSMDYTFAAPAPPISAPASTSYFQQQNHHIDSDPYPSLSQQPQASTSYTVYQPSHGRSLSSVEMSFEPSTSRGPRSANTFAGQQQQQHARPPLNQSQSSQQQQQQQQQRYNNAHHSRSSSVSSVQGSLGASMFRPHSQSISSSASSSFNGDSLANSAYGGVAGGSRDGASTPSGSNPIRRVNRLTNLDRKELCEYAALHPRMKHDLLGQLFNVERSTVSKILKNRTKWLAVKQDNTLSPPSSSSSTFPSVTAATMQQSPKRNTHSSSSSSSSLAGAGTDRPAPLTPSTSTYNSASASTSTATTSASAARPKIGGRHPELEVLLGEWGRSETRQGNILSDELVREQALKIAASLNIPISNFKASVGWLDNFKERMGYKNGEFDLDPKYEKLPDNHPDLKSKRNEEHRKAVRERKDNQNANAAKAGAAAPAPKMTLTVGTKGGEDMDEGDSVSPCWTPSEASYRSAGSGWLSPVNVSGGGNPLRVNTRESLSLSSSAASLPGLIEEDDDDFSEEDLIRSHHARNNTNTSSGSSGLRSSSRSSLALHSITGVHSNSSSTNPSPTSYTHPQLHGSDSGGANSVMQHMTTPRQQRHHPYQQQQHSQDYNHTPLSPHHASYPHHLQQFGNNKSMQQASIAFNLNINSTPLQTIEARTPLDLHSPTLPSELRDNSTSPAPAGLGFSHDAGAGPDNEAGLASSSSGRSVYSLRSRMASAPQTQQQQQQQMAQSTRTRQATYPQHNSSASGVGVQEQSSYMIPGYPTHSNPPAKFPLQRAHTAPMIPQLDEHHFDNAMGAMSPQSQPELYLSSDHYQQQYLMQGPPSSANSEYASQQMMQMDSDMTTVAHDSSSSHFSPHLQPFDSINNQNMQQQLLDREQAILAVEGQLSYTSPNAYSPTPFGGNALLPPGQSPHLLNPLNMSSTNPTGGSYGTSLSPAAAPWSERITFDEAYMALRKVVGFLHDQQDPAYQYGQQPQHQHMQAGLAAPNQVATLEHLLGQFKAASTSRYPHLTPPSST